MKEHRIVKRIGWFRTPHARDAGENFVSFSGKNFKTSGEEGVKFTIMNIYSPPAPRMKLRTVELKAFGLEIKQMKNNRAKPNNDKPAIIKPRTSGIQSRKEGFMSNIVITVSVCSKVAR